MKEILFICCIFLFAYSEALECGISVGKNEAELRKITKSCLSANDSVDSMLGINFSREQEESNEEIYTGPKRQFNLRMRRSENENDKRQEDTMTNTTNVESEETNSTEVTKNCVVQCVLQRLELTDGNGYPVHHRVLQMLLKTAVKRELRDFLQDSTDECFLRIEEEGEQLEPCAYSTKLVACLAEKGKSNCVDWPVGNLPLQG